MEIVLASRNAKKLAELEALLAPHGAHARSVAEWSDAPEVEETGATFIENAVLKVEAAVAATGLPSLADDSGLEVDVLGGRPGVCSARYAGESAGDDENIDQLLADLEEFDAEERQARFVCVLAYKVPGQAVRLYRGETAGRILAAREGVCGFGYDPVFWSEDLGKSFGQASPGEKNVVSHRGRALAAFVQDVFDRT